MGGPMSRMALIAACLVAGSASAQTPPELLFQAEAQTLTGTCTGQPVRLEGNHNTVTLTGACASLLLKGVSNTVKLGVAPGGTIHVEGSGNRVSFNVAGAPPAIEALGPDNEVVPGPAAASPPPPAAAPPVAPPPAASTTTLVLAGDDQQRLADCSGLDVTVTGNRSAYILRGACKSLTLRGDLLSVQAALAPGARIAITGQGSIVTWSAKPNTRPPITVVHGRGSRAQRAEPR